MGARMDGCSGGADLIVGVISVRSNDTMIGEDLEAEKQNVRRGGGVPQWPDSEADLVHPHSWIVSLSQPYPVVPLAHSASSDVIQQH